MRLTVIRNKVSNLQLYRLCIFPPISPLCTVLDDIRWFYTTFKICKMKENCSRINPLYSLSDRSTRGVSLQVDIQSGSNLFLPLPQIVFVVIGLTTVVWSGILKNDLLGIWAEVVISVNREKITKSDRFRTKTLDHLTRWLSRSVPIDHHHHTFYFWVFRISVQSDLLHRNQLNSIS